jgi:RNA polymerase sigma factor (sigma-70 family)
VLVTFLTHGGPGACADLDWFVTGPDPSALRKPRRMAFPRWGLFHPLCSTSAGGTRPVGLKVVRAPVGGLSDADLVGQLGAGDQRAMGLLYGRHARPARSLARRICLDVGIAEDVLQEVFLTVWCEHSRYDPARGSVATWLLTLVHHKSVDAVRREISLRRRIVSSSADAAEWSTAAEPGADEVAIGSVVAAQVRAALRRLPVGQRQVLTLSYFGGYTQREIATLIDVPVGTVKSRMFTGVRRLRASLGPLVSDLGWVELPTRTG